MNESQKLILLPIAVIAVVVAIGYAVHLRSTRANVQITETEYNAILPVGTNDLSSERTGAGDRAGSSTVGGLSTNLTPLPYTGNVTNEMEVIVVEPQTNSVNGFGGGQNSQTDTGTITNGTTGERTGPNGSGWTGTGAR